MSAGAESVPAIVLGGSGYVAGELLRLLAGHPGIRPAVVTSESQAGQPVRRAFPHLAGAYPDLAFADFAAVERLVAEAPRAALFSAAPHGASAPLVDRVLSAGERAGCELATVDLSADFRFATGEAYRAAYGHDHGAPHRLAEFACALPEHRQGVPARALGHPGCFVTATLLATVPLLAAGLIEPQITVVAVTGSTGAGRKPGDSTHHPARRSNQFAYSPLTHRHEPEMRALATAASGREAEISFLPQAGPFARGIHATVTARPAGGATAESVRETLRTFYAGSPFVAVGDEPPRLADVVGSNRCHLGAAASGELVAVFSVLDNLVKGAAGGGLQWMNRLLGFPEATGLTLPGLGWF